ncbi:hypothetical protein D3C87_1919730 [compost metagenome]
MKCRPPRPLTSTARKAVRPRAYHAANKTLYTVNLETGAATEIGPVTGLDNEVRDIAILPAM